MISATPFDLKIIWLYAIGNYLKTTFKKKVKEHKWGIWIM